MSTMLHHVAKVLGCRLDEVDDALRRETTLSRRNLFMGGAALAAGSLLVGGPLPLYVFTDDSEWYVAPNLAEALEQMQGHWGCVTGRYSDEPNLYQESPRARMSIWTNEDGSIASFDDEAEGATALQLTMAEWARRNGPGFLCTTER